jgi:peptidoglycan biosynthesis protein MviN/MurJ (putative lipid II flippase)
MRPPKRRRDKKRLSMALLKSESIKKGVSYSILISLLAKGLTFIAQMAILYYYGAGVATDVYFWCLTLVVSLTGLISSINAAVVIPHSMHLLNIEGEEPMRRFLGSVARRYLLVSLGVTLFLICFPEKSADWFSKFDHKAIAQNILLIRLITVSFPFVVCVTLLSDVFAIYKMFSAAIAVEAMKGALALLVFLGLRPWQGEDSLGWGFLAGTAAQATVLTLILKPRLGWFWGRSWGSLPAKVRKDITYTLTGQSFSFLLTLFTAYLISGFTAGIFSSMNCATSLTGLIQMVFLTRICYVVGIYFTELYSQGRYQELNAMFLRYLRPSLLALFIALPIVAFFSDHLVALAFQRGNFHRADVLVTSEFFRIFILALPMLMVNLFVNQLILGAKKVGTAFYMQILYNVSNMIVIGLLVSHVGYLGYPWGLGLIRLLYLFVQWYFIRITFPFLDFGAALRYLARNLAMLMAAGAAIWPLRHMQGPWFGLALPPAIAVALFVWPENRQIVSKVMGMVRGRLANG